MARRAIADARILVTGASSGIGHELARMLGRRGAKLLLTARRENRLEALADEIRAFPNTSGVCQIVAGDLTSAAVRDRLAASCDAWQGLDVLVNNAGLGAIGRFDATDEERLRRVMELNFFAPVELTRQLLPALRSGRDPAIVMVGSVLALAAVPLKSEYCASKFALHGWSESLRLELASDGIDVIETHPSTTESEFFDNVLGDPAAQQSVGSVAPDYVARKILRAIELGRVESIFPMAGKALVALRRWAPAIYRRLVRPKNNPPS